MEQRMAKTIDERIKTLRLLKSPQERLEELLYICTKLACEIDACFEMFDREKTAREILEKKLTDLTEEMRKFKKAVSPDE